MALSLLLVWAFLAPEAPVATAWVVEGRISDMPHAHPINPQRGKVVLYVDTVGEGQVVAYVKAPAPERGAWVRLSGSALEFETTSPRPGSTKKFKVKQLDVAAVEPLSGSDAVQAALSREDLEAEVLRAGKDAIPVLIAGLESSRLPQKDKDACLQLLVKRIAGSEAQPKMLDVVDWGAWWLRHRSQSLEEIQAGLAPRIDEYRKTGKPARIE
jgi:hypothetical protein